MNREIKFRIWADNKFYNKCLVGNTNNTNDEKWTCPMVWLEKQKEWVHCDNGIICQYTGLHDKNGKEIYEGDILKSIQWNDIYLVKYIGTAFYLCRKGNNGFNKITTWNNAEKSEVIGNVFENGDILNDSKNTEKN